MSGEIWHFIGKVDLVFFFLCKQRRNIHLNFSAKNKQKNKNTLPGPEKQYSFKTKKSVRASQRERNVLSQNILKAC